MSQKILFINDTDLSNVRVASMKSTQVAADAAGIANYLAEHGGGATLAALWPDMAFDLGVICGCEVELISYGMHLDADVLRNCAFLVLVRRIGVRAYYRIDFTLNPIKPTNNSDAADQPSHVPAPAQDALAELATL